MTLLQSSYRDSHTLVAILHKASMKAPFPVWLESVPFFTTPQLLRSQR